MSSGAEVIELSSDDDEGPAPGSTALARRAPSSPPDVKPYLLAEADVKPLLLPLPLHPPGYGALVPVKTEDPVATVSPPPRALPPPRLCRQFWKSGDYVVARRNPDANTPGRLLAGEMPPLDFCRLFAFLWILFWWGQAPQVRDL
jgi:hypothetical protein